MIVSPIVPSSDVLYLVLILVPEGNCTLGNFEVNRCLNLIWRPILSSNVADDPVVNHKHQYFNLFSLAIAPFHFLYWTGTELKHSLS